MRGARPEDTAEPSAVGAGRPAWRLFLASAALLFAELLVVRWTGASLPRLAFFKNLVLIAAFLGGGLGMAIGPRRPGLARLSIPLLLLFVLGVPLAAVTESLQTLRFGGSGEYVWGLAEARTLGESVLFIAFLVAVFLASLALFVALGALVGVRLEGHAPLAGYAWNLGGSLAGVLAFAAASALELGPGSWISLLALPLGFALATGIRGILLALVVAVAGLFPGLLASEAFWSPYSRISLTRVELARDRVAYRLDVNHVYFMTMLPLGRVSSDESRRLGLAAARLHYDLPYMFADARRVLILGAGAGNDAAAALRAGAAHVDAVEIDPSIIRIGRRLHPDAPYRSPKVAVHVDDARAFLRRHTETWDLIVLGLLDSHTLLAGLPGVRLDNYVYTRESFQDIRRRLAPDGLLALSFAVPEGRDWIAAKLYRLVRETFPDDPVAMFAVGYDVSVAFLAGPGLRSGKARGAVQTLAAQDIPQRRLEAQDADVATPEDDWPHLYLRSRGVPPGHMILLAVLLSVSLLVTRALAPAAGRPDLHFALLGAGFLLVETKGIADLGLLFGGTWWTVTATVAAVLVMALGSTGYVARVRPTRVTPYYVGLVASLGLAWLVKPGLLLAFPLPVAQSVGSLLVALPVFFSGVVFAASFQRVSDPAGALGSNLVGAVVGGFLEYASLVWGVRSLSLVAMALYLASAAALFRGSEPRP